MVRILGVVLLVLGLEGVFLHFPYLAQAGYPLLWWGILLLLDEAVFAVREKSPLKTEAKQFWLLLVPVSVIYWIWYEYLNLVFPQWQYVGTINGLLLKVLFGFFSFATVLPIIVELQWLLFGPSTGWTLLSKRMTERVIRYKYYILTFGIICTVLPLVSPWFWPNQLMWIGPLFITLPFIGSIREVSGTKIADFWWAVTVTGLLSGFLWESLNFWAAVKWHYLIFPQLPHAFEMPLPGYLGFIPFALSSLAVYLAVKKHFKATLRWGLVLYAAAIVLMYTFVIDCVYLGMWK